MNKIEISLEKRLTGDETTLAVSYAEANRLLPILRSDHFQQISLKDASQVVAKEAKFLIQLMRLLTSEGRIILDNADNQQLNTFLKALNFHERQHTSPEIQKLFLKTLPKEPEVKLEEKLAIGFHAVKLEEEIDQSELLEGEGLNIKKEAASCDTKPRACANCSCGRKDVEVKVTKEELIKSVNEGNPVSGCGKCFLGDSFRCGTCPYKGLPAFKPGDRLKLQQDGGVQVESAATFVSVGGKVKLEL